MTAKPATLHLSIVVSSRNRAPDVARFLDHVSHTRCHDATRWELIFVDNGSTDDTAEVVRHFSTIATFPMQYLLESQPGKSRGVNAGILASRGEIIALTDDDAWVSETWVQDIVDHFAMHSDTHCIGGRVVRAYPDLAELAIRESLEPESVSLDGFSALSIQLIGCNMSVRRSLLRQLGLFDPNLGPGVPAQAGEDLDFLYRIVAAGHALHYVPNVLVHHNHGRRSPLQISAVRAGYLRGRGAFYAKQLLQRDALASRWAYWEILANLKRWLRLQPPADGAPAGQILAELARGAWAYLAHQRVSVPDLQAERLP